MTVREIKSFIWDKDKALNYSRSDIKWPFSQSLIPFYEINSAVFINSINNYKLYQDRIGKNVYFKNVDLLKSTDIDWPEDFEIAEKIFKSKSCI